MSWIDFMRTNKKYKNKETICTDDKKDNVYDVSKLEFRSNNNSNRLPYSIVINGDVSNYKIEFIGNEWKLICYPNFISNSVLDSSNIIDILNRIEMLNRDLL